GAAFPNIGSSGSAISKILSTLVQPITVPATIIIAPDIIPPITIEITVSQRANFNLSIVPNLSNTEVECRKKLYGTTVVPISAITIIIDPEGIEGISAPLATSPQSGFTANMAVTKVPPIITSKTIISLSITL